MPESRLQKTREAKPEVPACIRLGHEMWLDRPVMVWRCIRCTFQKQYDYSAMRVGTIVHLDNLKRMTVPAHAND